MLIRVSLQYMVVKVNLQHLKMQYSEVIKEILMNVDILDGIVVGFNVNIDAIKRVDCNFLESLPKPKKIRHITRRTIKNIDDLVSGLYYCMMHGIGDEWIIKEKKLFDWINKNISKDSQQIGGQGGNMANVAAALGVKKVIVNLPIRNKEIAAFFINDNVKIPYRINNKIELISARKITNSDVPPIHWIFEFHSGLKIKIDKLSFTVPKSNRFIATYDPYIATCQLLYEYKKLPRNIISQIDSFIVGGLHLIRTDFLKNPKRKFVEIKTLFQRWRKYNNNALIYLEFGPSSNTEIFRMINDFLSKEIDILGIGDDDLAEILIALGKEKMAQMIKKDKSPIIIFDSVFEILKKSQFNEILLHCDDFAINIMKKDNESKNNFVEILERRKKSIMLGHLVCATRALIGKFPTIDDIKYSFLHEKIFLDKTKVDRCKELCKIITKNYNFSVDDFMFFGFDNETDKKIIGVCVPALTLKDIKLTVGLGDSFAVSFGIAEGVQKKLTKGITYRNVDYQ